jgi:hypothetical protein
VSVSNEVGNKCLYIIHTKYRTSAVSWIMQLATGLSPRTPRFCPGSVRVRFVKRSGTETGSHPSSLVSPYSIIAFAT